MKSTLSMIRVPPVAGTLESVREVLMPFGVLVKMLSWTSTDPTVWLFPPFAISIPNLQLLMDKDLNVHSQFQFMKIAVLTLLKVRLRVVNC